MTSENKNFWKVIVLLVIILLPTFIYLTIKAKQVNGWDDWQFGSAQTMSTARFWAEDGFIKHKFLFITHGYHPQIEFLDEPEFRFWARGTATGGLIGTRLWYTHYPPGYLIPYGLLAKAGVQERFWFRMLALCFSFASVIFLFGFVYLITNRNKWIPLLAVFYYSTSTTFLAYADSLNNTPVDDFFKWGILFLSIYGVKKLSEQKLNRKFEKIIWLLFFLLAISSYDSTFFIFFWLCALSYIAGKNEKLAVKWYKRVFLKTNLRKYFFWASAPLTAFALQMIQNTWYLGFKNMILDVWGSFAHRSGEIPAVLGYLPPIIQNLANALAELGFFTDLRTRMALPIILAIVYCLYKKKKFSDGLPQYVSILAFGGLLFGFILPVAGIFGYQGRQLAPVLLLIIAIATYEAVLILRKLDIRKTGAILAVLVLIIWSAHFKDTLAYIEQWPNNAFAMEKVQYWQKLNKITDANTIILNIGKETGSECFSEEFYVGRLILSFEDLDIMLQYMNKINSALSDKGNFLLILPGEYEETAVNFAKDRGYNIRIENNSNLQNNLTYIHATHY